MLILTRRPGEAIVIAEDIHLTVVSMYKNQVRLAFNAPQNIPIYREEIHKRMLLEQQINHIPMGEKSLDEELIERLTAKFNMQAIAA